MGDVRAITFVGSIVIMSISRIGHIVVVAAGDVTPVVAFLMTSKVAGIVTVREPDPNALNSSFAIEFDKPPLNEIE